mgnify:CR=1 FL=1
MSGCRFEKFMEPGISLIFFRTTPISSCINGSYCEIIREIIIQAICPVHNNLKKILGKYVIWILSHISILYYYQYKSNFFNYFKFNILTFFIDKILKW